MSANPVNAIFDRLSTVLNRNVADSRRAQALARQLDGRVIFDMLQYCRREHKLSSYSLNSVSAHFLGHSMGGRIALSLAQNFPGKVKSLIMAASGSGTAGRTGSDTVSRMPHRLVLALIEMGFEKFIYDEVCLQDNFFTEAFRKAHPDKVQEFFKIAWATHAKLDPFIHLCMARHEWDGTHRLGDLQAPTLVLIGEGDTIDTNHVAQAKVLHERIPGAQLKVLKEQSHGFFWQAPELTNQTILEWVKRHSGK